METAANPKFKKNLYHKALYSWHVLSDRTIPNPGLPPYYDAQFFMKIKAVLEEGLLNVTTMSSSTWYKVLLENSITHIVDNNGTLIFKPSRAELNFPERNWEMIWHLAVTPGLPSELLSFLWQLFHNILPTRERLFRMNMPNITNPTCDLCNMNTQDSLQHALLECPSNNTAGTFLLKCMQAVAPNLQSKHLFTFNYNIDQDMRLPIMYIFSSVLLQFWTCRKVRRPCNILSIRASLEAGIQILRKSRHKQASDKLEQILVSM